MTNNDKDVLVFGISLNFTYRLLDFGEVKRSLENKQEVWEKTDIRRNDGEKCET